MNVRKVLFGFVPLAVLLPMTLPVQAASHAASHEARIEELEAKVERLEQLLESQVREMESCVRPEEMEKALESCASVEQVERALGQDSPTLFNETAIKVGGYVKIDALLSDYSNAPTRGVGDDFYIPSTISPYGMPADPRLNIHAKETRFWLKSFTPTPEGDITTHFEIDFLLGQQGDERVGNSFSPRIRHASVGWNRWIFGQTWSNFFNVSALPDYFDFIGPVGVTFVRQAQLRYSVPTANGNWAFSFENPDTTLTPFGGGSRIDANDGSFPDIVVRRNISGDWGQFSAAALIRELKIDAMGFDDAAFGAAIGLAAKLKVGERDDFRWQLNYGNALGRYLGLNSYNVGTLDANGDIELTSQFGVFGAWRHVWNEYLHSSFGASFSSADNDTAISGFDVPKSYRSAHANLIWSPFSRMYLGAEYIWGVREDENGAEGVLKRLLFSAKYVY